MVAIDATTQAKTKPNLPSRPVVLTSNDAVTIGIRAGVIALEIFSKLCARQGF
jgi:hypothetical protein